MRGQGRCESYGRGSTQRDQCKKLYFLLAWNDLTTSSPALRRMLLVTQSDATVRTKLEMSASRVMESNLKMLNEIFPRHMIEFLVEGSGSTERVPHEMGRLARSHEDVSILFMDIVGEWSGNLCCVILCSRRIKSAAAMHTIVCTGGQGMQCRSRLFCPGYASVSATMQASRPCPSKFLQSPS